MHKNLVMAEALWGGGAMRGKSDLVFKVTLDGLLHPLAL